jgi:GAF domain-containing protein
MQPDLMSEDLTIISGSKTEQYQSLLPQVRALVEGEPDLIANLANITGALKEQFGWLWVGFYLVQGEELVLGPFQGPVACTRIRKGRGVCGTAWETMKTLIVPDVNAFPGHISCNSSSKSEIVIPLILNKQVTGVFDADSSKPEDFDTIDQLYLGQILSLIRLS